jgi:signal peptidase II
MYRNSNGGETIRPNRRLSLRERAPFRGAKGDDDDALLSEAFESRQNVLSVSLAILAVAFAASAVSADDSFRDRVALRVKGRRTPLTLFCKVVDYTGRSITVRNAAGMLRSYPTADVLDVQTPQTEAHVRGLLAFSRGDYKTARLSFQTALAEEPRDWMKRELRALLVRCALRTGDRKEAIEQFLALVDSDPSTQHFALVPLTWATEKLDAAQKTIAQGRLLGTKSAPRLIAASQLLFDPRFARQAEAALKQLRSDVDSRISRLAEIQLWRKALQRGHLLADEVADWKKVVARLPVKLRGGGNYLLGQAYLQQKNNERAAAALLWLPLVYDDDRQLAARASLEAAEALQEIGRTSEAVTLFREVRTRFADTEFAQEAAAQLARYAKAAKSR